MEQPTTSADEAAAGAAASTMALEEPASPPPSDQSSSTEEPGIILANPVPPPTMGQSGEDVYRKDEASSPLGEASGPRKMAREERENCRVFISHLGPEGEGRAVKNGGDASSGESG